MSTGCTQSICPCNSNQEIYYWRPHCVGLSASGLLVIETQQLQVSIGVLCLHFYIYSVCLRAWRCLCVGTRALYIQLNISVTLIHLKCKRFFPSLLSAINYYFGFNTLISQCRHFCFYHLCARSKVK